MSNLFRELLKKVGSGPHTGKDLSRQEAAEAMRMMLLQEATPAQIGAFLIAHRIKRPTSEELAGMLDAYDQLGPKLQPLAEDRPVVVLGVPYDGRSRTAPVNPLTALILAAAGVCVILHGGTTMPTKYGISLVEIWQGLGVDWTGLSLEETQRVFEATGIGLIYLPQHFPLADQLVPYRDQIGKRPPLAMMELMWCPYAGEAHVVSGFVHPPTEELFRGTFALRKPQVFTTVKGLEGSCDLSRDRTAIIGLGQPTSTQPLDRLLLHPRDYGFAGTDVPLSSPPELIEQLRSVLQADASELLKSVLWNGGFYLWRCGVCDDVQSGLAQAQSLLTSGQVARKLQEIARQVTDRAVSYHSVSL